MIDVVVELQSVLLGIAVTTVLSILTALFRTMIQRRKDRKVWDKRSDTVSILLATTRTDTGTYGRPVTGLGQARAVGLMAPMLSRCYRDPSAINVELSAFSHDSRLEGDLVLLGGPKNNEITRRALQRLDRDLPVTMKTDGDERLYRRQGEFEEPFPDVEDVPPRDGLEGVAHGLIVRTENCFDLSGTLTIFAGVHTYGTAAAVRFVLENEGTIGSLGDRFAIVVRSHVTPGEHVERPTMVGRPMEF